LETTLSETQKRLLATIFERGAESAAKALTQWLGRPVHLAVSTLEQLDLAEATDVLGPGDTLVAACVMQLSGGLSGQILLVFEDRAGLTLADVLLRRPVGSSADWGDLERSAALETANIVGCAYLNSLAAHLPGLTPGDSSAIVPSPPEFRHEFAASLLEFALMDQAAESDRLLVIRTRLSSGPTELDWSLLFVPTGASVRALMDALAPLGGR
jgi:chemotaxis protein CheC